MQKIVPFLWFDNNGEEAAKFYVSIFENSKLTGGSKYDETLANAAGMKENQTAVVSFELDGLEIQGINGGPVFKPTPSVSFFVSCDTTDEADQIWNKLSEGAKVLMEYEKYPFSEKYGWLNDRFGVSWQIFTGKGKQKITPFLMFTGDVVGKAEEAMNFYTSLFENSKVTAAAHYEPGMGDLVEYIVHGEFELDGIQFMAMDSGLEHRFNFSEANSFLVNTDSQEEIDHFWSKLTENGGAPGQCGWLKDKYGLSWQIFPIQLGKFMTDADPEKKKRVTEAMLKMTKLDIAELQKAYDDKK